MASVPSCHTSVYRAASSTTLKHRADASVHHGRWDTHCTSTTDVVFCRENASYTASTSTAPTHTFAPSTTRTTGVCGSWRMVSRVGGGGKRLPDQGALQRVVATAKAPTEAMDAYRPCRVNGTRGAASEVVFDDSLFDDDAWYFDSVS